jgi:hypothetical protein
LAAALVRLKELSWKRKGFNLRPGFIPPTQIKVTLGKPVLVFAFVFVYLIGATSLSARAKDGVQYGAGLIMNVPFPENEVEQVVQDVVQNGIIRGTKEYNKDEYVSGANAESTVRVFPRWTEGGKVFYKVRMHALDPRNFKDSGDLGTLAVRYVVQPQGEKNSIVHINAVFVEDFRRTVHQSNGSVESAEFKDIHDRLEELALMQTQTAEALREKEEHSAGESASTETAQSSSSSSSAQPGLASSPTQQLPASQSPAQNVENSAAVTAPQPTPPAAENSEQAAHEAAAAQVALQTLEEQVKDLRQQVERKVKSPGAALRSAPFHTASTLQTLPTGTEVLIVINTPYWLGVETHDGQHGWILRDELELLQ